MANQQAIYIRTFLASVQPLRGCCYCNNTGFHAGRAAIERLAMAYDEQDDNLDPSLAQCAEMLEFLSNAEPIDPARHHAAGNGETCGLNVILDYVQASIRENLETSHGN